MEDYVLIFDSGNGGQYVFEQFVNQIHNQNVILYKDTLFCPYGDKDKDILKSHIIKLFGNLFKRYNIKLVIIACNTISSMFKTIFKKHFKNTKFLFIEPLITKKILGQKTLLLATSNTIKSNKKIKKYKNNPNLICIGFPNLAKQIDDNINNLDEVLPFLKNNLSKLCVHKFNNIILGCTHYNLIKKQLKKLFGKVNFIDNTQNQINKATKFLLQQNNFYPCPKYIIIDNSKLKTQLK